MPTFNPTRERAGHDQVARTADAMMRVGPISERWRPDQFALESGLDVSERERRCEMITHDDSIPVGPLLLRLR